MAALIVSQRAEHGVPHAVSCRALGVSQAWFYKWRRGDYSLRGKHRAVLAAQVDYLFAKHYGTYGSPRITADLRELGYRVSVNTVAKVMAEKDLVARRKHRRRSTTRPDRSARKAPDAVNRDFTPRDRPDVTWCGDLTDIPTDEGAFYLLLTWNLTAGWIVTDRHRNHGVRGHVARERGGKVARPGSARTCCRVAGHLDQSGSCPANHRRVFAGAGGVSADL